VDGVPLPTTAALIGWFAASTRERPFIEGGAATNLAAEGQVPGAFCPFARAFERHYGCTREQVAFWDVHEHAESESTARSVITSSLAWRPRRRSKPTCAGPSVARSSSGGGSSRDRHRRRRLLNAARLLEHEHAARGRPLAHRLERLVHAIEWQAGRDHLVQTELSAGGELDGAGPGGDGGVPGPHSAEGPRPRDDG